MLNEMKLMKMIFIVCSDIFVQILANEIDFVKLERFLL